MIKGNILVIGALGQVGRELVMKLEELHGPDSVIATDVKFPEEEYSSTFELLNVLDSKMLLEIIKKHQVKEVYLLAALLSATAEQKAKPAWDLNMNGLFNVLELAREKIIDKLFWPSSIAVFGHHSPKDQTPQHTIMDPSTIYGISKLAGERWCQYYHNKHGVDVRSIRYPGLIGYRSLAGGGTTDYAVDIFHEAVRGNPYTCYLKPTSRLPMMYMKDAIRATTKLMNADTSRLSLRSGYNVAGCSFSPEEITQAIQKHIPDFKVDYQPDERQSIADTWPNSIDDSLAQKDWGWKADYLLPELTVEMLENIEKR